MNILVIDDEPVRARWFQDALEPAGHHVRVAPAPEDALAQMHEVEFDLVFFDHDLGRRDMNGSQLAFRIFSHPKKYKKPRAVWIHTSNPVGAQNIAAKCRSAEVKFGVGKFESFMEDPASLLTAITKLVTQ